MKVDNLSKLMRRFPDIALASVRISLPENKENQHREEPDYGVSQDKVLLCC